MPRAKAYAAADDADRNLYQRSGTWWCRYYVGGQERRKSLRTTDVKTARKERDQLLASAGDERAGRAPPPPPPKAVLWQDVVEGWLGYLDGHVASGRLVEDREEVSVFRCPLGRGPGR